ncbi:hypothetical protein ACFXNW_04030 [Nocardia sp. NPDC059180]|uniref:hypothetical protein n=1 Tax=Nocardia sp. NPDC059180 TaxID=3346761 RepID=UPI0036A7B0D4
MSRITRLTVSALFAGAILSPVALAQAEAPQPAPRIAMAEVADTGSAGTGSAGEAASASISFLMRSACVILRLVKDPTMCPLVPAPF